jgi:hypothetical protein
LSSAKVGADAVFVEQRQDAKNSDPVAVFVLAPATGIGELRLVAALQPLGTAERAYR